MSETVEVRLASGKFGDGDGGLYTEGDTFDVPEVAVAEHPQLSPVSDGEPQGSSGEDATEAPFDPADKTVSELRDELDGSYSDAEREALANAEARAENRDSAIEVLAP